MMSRALPLLCLLVSGCPNQLERPIAECRLIFGEVVAGGEQSLTQDPCRETDGAPESLPDDVSYSNLRLETPWYLGYRLEAGALIFEADLHTPRSPAAEAGTWNEASGAYGYQYGETTGGAAYQMRILPPAEPRYNLTLLVHGGGLVGDDVLGCREDGGVCVASYGVGEEVELVALPADGWKLQRSTCPERLTLAMDTECDVEFVPIDGFQPFSVTVRGPGGVRISASNQVCTQEVPCRIEVAKGAVVTLTAQGDVERHADFVGWSGCAAGTETPLEVTVDGPTECVAVFQREGGPDCTNPPPITPGLIEIFDSHDQWLGDSQAEECTVRAPRYQAVGLRATGFQSNAGPIVLYAWDVDQRQDTPFTPDAYGQEITVPSLGFGDCRVAVLRVTDACGTSLDTYVTF